MKKLLLLIACILFMAGLNAQSWKTDIFRVSGKPAIKTLKLRPKMKINIGTLLLDTDSLKKSINYDGSFLCGTQDSLQVRINQIEINKIHTNGLSARTITPAKYYTATKPDTVYKVSIALSDIHSIRYQKGTQKVFAAMEDFTLLGSLAVLLISPFFCYDYKDGTFNAECYKYWALGSTAGIAVGFSFQMLGGHTKLQFRPNWPKNDAKVWSFK